MIKPWAAVSEVAEMGQTSSQLDNPSAMPSNKEHAAMSSDKKRTSRKHKRKSADAEQSLDPEQESARVLLQMRGGDVPENRASHYGDDFAASQQLVTGHSQLPSHGPPNFASPNTTTSHRPKRHGKSAGKAKKKRRGSDTFTFSSSDNGDTGSQYPRVPSTPPGQTDYSSPLPHRPTAPQSHHALDEVPTDDEFEKEFGTGTASAEPTMPVHDIFSFSQQPELSLSQQDSLHPRYQLPAHAPNKASKKHRKRKRRDTSQSGLLNEHQIPLENGAGQHSFTSSFDCEYQSFDVYFRYSGNLANPFGDHQDYDMPIDPELHSISALQPAADLSVLDDSNINIEAIKTRKSVQNRSLPPKKRRRMQDTQSSVDIGSSYCSPYMTHDDQENLQDRVLPGLEDMQRQTSPELGTPFMEDIARGGLEYLNSASKPTKGSRHKKNAARDSASAPAAQPESSQKDKHPERSLKEVSEKGGPFASTEIAKLDSFRERYCDANKMNYGHFNSLIQTPMRGNAQVAALFNELHEVLPYRPRMSVQKYVRRRFHNYTARGTWTAEEDEMLKHAVDEKGKSWKAVGEIIDRMPGDCRDRWRNYIFKSEHRNREQWTDAEVRNLCIAILECIQLMKNQRQQAREEKYGLGAAEVDENSDQEVEDMKVINWQVVSDRMGENGNGRSRLQCSLKWSQLKKRDQNNLLKAIRELGEFEVERPAPTKNPWRHVRTSKRVANMRTGDRYTLLQAVAGSNAPTEGNIPWRLLGDDGFRVTWNAADKKEAWLTMKDTIPNSQSMDYREVVNRLLTHILAEGAMELDERWNPELHGDVSQTKTKKSKKAKGKEKEKEDRGARPKRKGRYQRGNERKMSIMSNEFVQESDDEDEADAADELQNNNRYTTLPRSEKANRYADRTDQDVSMTGDEEAADANEVAQGSDQDSLFDEPVERSEYQSRENGEVSPEMASKIQLLQYE